MDKFDVKELEGVEKQSMFSKFMKGVGNSVAKLFQKYDTMGYEVEKVYVLLKKYENDFSFQIFQAKWHRHCMQGKLLLERKA